MILDLDKDDLISLVKGCDPSYSVMNNVLVKKHGTFSGSYGIWDWNTNSLRKCSEEELLEIYKLCKNNRY